MTKINVLSTAVQRLTLIVFWLGLGSQCTQQTVDKQGGGPCRLRQMDCHTVTTGSGTNDSDVTEKAVYRYDAADQLIGKTDQAVYRYDQADSIVFNTTETYVYDGAGFLMSKTALSQVKDHSTTTANSERVSYTYATGRLAQAVAEQLSESGLQTKEVSTYTYNAAGVLTQRLDATTYPVISPALRDRPAYPGGFTETWTYQHGQAIEYVKQAAGMSMKPYTFQNGLIQVASDSVKQRKYTYDKQNRVVRLDESVASKLTDYQELIYGSVAAIMPEVSLPAFNGFPVVADPHGAPGVATTHRVYVVSGSGDAYVRLDEQAQYELTGVGYVQTAMVTTTVNRTGIRPITYPIKMTVTYTYNGNCD